MNLLSGVQSMMGGSGVEGAQFNSLFALFTVVTGVAYLLVVIFLGAALVRRRRELVGGRLLRPLFAAWLGFIVIGLSVLVVASFLTDRSSALAAAGRTALRIEVTANQWWWDIDYVDPVPGRRFRTANELHLPAGVPALVTLRANDVIHSFWIPNLAGKQDLIPGRVTDILLQPRDTGVYRGQCAEFCGTQHAHMALDVVVEPPERFARWQAHQRRPASPPQGALERAGHAYVTTRECSVCHTIAGTAASGQIAPDLTHLASRRSIAAGTFPMSRGHLYAWIADPQGAKPGNHMPYIGLEKDELHAVIAYLERLR